MKKKNIFLAIISMILLFQIPASAQKFWVGGTSSDWNTGSNWSPAGVPAATDNVTIQALAPAATQNCVLTSNVTCAGLTKTGTAFRFVVGAFTMTVNGNVAPNAALNGFLFTPIASSVIIITGTVGASANRLLDAALGTVRFEGTSAIIIPTNQSNFGTMVVNKTGAGSVSVDAVNLNKFLEITLQSGTLITALTTASILPKLNITGTSTIDIFGAGNSELKVANVEVFGGTCTMTPSDNLVVSGNWTQSGTGTFINTDATNGVIFTGATSGDISSTAGAINIQANVRILKTAPATVNMRQPTTIGTTAANKNLVVETGTLVLDLNINESVAVNGSISIINIGIINATKVSTSIIVTRNFTTSSSTLTLPLIPFVIAPGSTGVSVIFTGGTNSIIDVGATTAFNIISITKSFPNNTVTHTPTSVIRVEWNMTVLGGTFVAVNTTLAGVTARQAISAINNGLHRTLPKQIPASPISALTINQLTGETVNIPDPDVFIKRDLIIASGASFDLGSNEPQNNDAETICLHIGKTLNDANNLYPSNGTSIALTLDANNNAYPINPGTPRGLYIGLSTTKPMGDGRDCGNTNGEVSYGPGLSPRSNYEIPTIVFFGSEPGIITGNVTNLPDFCGTFNRGNGISLPNVFIYKTDVHPAANHNVDMQISAGQNLRIHGNFVLLVGTFRVNSRLLLFGDYAGKDGATLADDLAEDDKMDIFGLFDMGTGSQLFMHTGAEERGTIIRVRKGGYFKSVGTAAAPNEITREGTPGQYYRFCVYNGGGIASFRTKHTFMSARSDDAAGLGSNENTQPPPANIGDLPAITASPNYDLIATDSNVATETGPGSGHGWIDSKGGLKVLFGAIVNPEGTSSLDPEYITVDHNFSYATFDNGGPNCTFLTINTGQELDIYGTTFGNGASNIVGNSRIYFAASGTDPANINVITLLGTLGAIGGAAGEQFDGGKNDQDIAPLFDLIRWKSYLDIYWVGDYDGTTVATPAQPAFPPFIPAQPAQSAQPFRNQFGEGVGSKLEFVAGTGTVDERHSGSNTAWNNPRNWSLSNRSYYNPYQIYPGQPTPNGYPKKINTANPTGAAPAFGALLSTVPSDTLEKFEVQITRTATSSPTMNVANLTVDGSITVNSGIVKDFGVLQIRTANSSGGGGVQKRMARADIIPQVTDAQQTTAAAPEKRLTIAGGNTLNIGGDLQVNVNGRVRARPISTIRIKGNIEAFSNLAVNNQQPPANGNPATNDNAFLNPTDILPSGTSPALVRNFIQLDFEGASTLVLDGRGSQTLRVARNPLHNLVISKPSGEAFVQGLTFDQRTLLNMTGDFTLTGGKFTMLSTCPLLINGNAVLNSSVSPATFTFGSSAITVRGSWTNTGAIVNSGTGQMNFHPNNLATKTITSNNQSFPSVHFGFFEDLDGDADSYHQNALPESHPPGGPINPLGNLLVGMNTYIIQDNFTATGLTTIYANRTVSTSTLPNTTVPLRLSGLRIIGGGILDLKAGAELLMDATLTNPLFTLNSINGQNTNAPAGKNRTLLVEEGARLNAVGTASRFVKISRDGSTGFYRFIVEGTIQAQFFLFEFMDARGVDLSGLTTPAEGAGVVGAVNGSNISNTSGILGSTSPLGRGESINIAGSLGSFSDGIFTNGESTGGAAYLRLPDNYAPSNPLFIQRTSFPLATAGYNVSKMNNIGAVITDFVAATGIFSGEDKDEETNAPDDIRWTDNIKRWDGRANGGGAVQTNNNWSNRFNWEGDVVPTATDVVSLDFFTGLPTPNRNLQYDAGTKPYIVDVDAASVCKSLIILPRTTPTPVRTITLNVNAPLTIGDATGGDFSAGASAIINVNGGAAINVSGGWSNDGQFNSNGAGIVTFGPATGSRVVKAGANDPRNNPFFDVVFGAGTTELNSTLFVDNNLTVNTGAILDASIGSSSIVLQGDWANAGLFKPRRGRVTFAGGLTPLLNKSQRLKKTGTPTFESFWELRIAKGDTIGNTASPFNVTLDSRVFVGESGPDRGGALLLRNGKFITSSGAIPSPTAGTQMILTDQTNWIRQTNAPSTSGFVQGPLGRIYSSNTSRQSASYPIGKDNSYMAGNNGGDGQVLLEVRLNQPNRTTFTIEQVNANPEDFSLPATTTRTLPPGINQVSSTRWWDVKNIDFPTPLASTRLLELGEISLPFRAIEEQPVPATIFGVTYGNGGGQTPLDASLIGQLSILQDFDAQDGTILRGVPNTAATTAQIRRGFAPQEGTRWEDLGGIADLANATTTITSRSNFTTLGNGQFTFGFFFVPLPVELLDLKAEVVGEKVRVSWITVSEKNNDYFIVEKSIDAKNFEEVGRVPAKTSTSALNNYEIFDVNPYQTINYYRLKQFDTNGKFTYSKIISIKMGKTTANNLSIYPNPTTNNEFVVDLKGTDLAGTQVTVTDMLGKTVYSTKIEQNGTFQNIRPNTTLAAGMYIVTVQTNEKVYQQRLSVK